MPKLEIQPIEEGHLGAAAELLAERHAAHRRAEPLLPEADAAAEVRAAWEADGATGWMGFSDGEPAGYLIGSPRGEIWGDGNVWVELAGHAVREPEIVRDLYAVAAKAWVEQDVRRHYALVPATDRALVDAWFRLSFGAQHAQGIRETPAPAKDRPEFTVRRAGPDDVETAARLDVLLPHYQAGSPVFGPTPQPSFEELVEEYRESIDDDGQAIFLVERAGEALGLLIAVDVTQSSMHAGISRPDRAAFLGLATTVPEARGSGAGLALTEAFFGWARQHGYETVVVDWRETNLHASRFWPNRGFRRTFQRLYRSIH